MAVSMQKASLSNMHERYTTSGKKVSELTATNAKIQSQVESLKKNNDSHIQKQTCSEKEIRKLKNKERIHRVISDGVVGHLKSRVRALESDSGGKNSLITNLQRQLKEERSKNLALDRAIEQERAKLRKGKCAVLMEIEFPNIKETLHEAKLGVIKGIESVAKASFSQMMNRKSLISTCSVLAYVVIWTYRLFTVDEMPSIKWDSWN